MTFQEQLRITLIDKLLLALLVVVAGALLNRALERYKSERALQNDLTRQRADARLRLLAQQLSELYWPVFLRLQKDNAVWSRLLDRKHEDELRRKIGRAIELNCLIPNHDEIVKILEAKVHLAAGDEALLESSTKYLRHIAIYRALRAADAHDLDPKDVGEPWPNEFFEVIERRTRALQAQYDALLHQAGDL